MAHDQVCSGWEQKGERLQQESGQAVVQKVRLTPASAGDLQVEGHWGHP